MYKHKDVAMKGGVILLASAMSSGLAFGQASIFVSNEYMLQSQSLEQEFPPISQSSNTGGVSGAAAVNASDKASSSLITHTLSASVNAHEFVLLDPNGFTNNGPTIAESGNANATLTDTITFHSTGMVTFGVSGLNIFNTVSGNVSSGSIFDMAVYAPNNTVEGQADQQTAYGGASQSWNAATQMLQTIPGSGSGSTVTSGLNGANYQITDGLDNTEMHVSFLAQANVTYTFYSFASSTMGYTFNSGQASPGLPVGYEAPWGGSPWGGVAQVDPMWNLTLTPGQTYTTGSGFGIPLATPEPTSFVGLAAATLGLLIRRRKNRS